MKILIQVTEYTEQVIFKAIYVYKSMNVTIMKEKVGMNLKEGNEGYMGGFEKERGRKT